ncbi:MAG: c-type cytochrome biogenesis protein CcmI [Rhodoplanes sp.]|uniref:c-type cytochrome biogenesis protein CcmI n=1 Tax=Rhodoplanes sp. TaxID=1968906 RepID=UPI00180EA8A4|nr:c-type cytochrome biogenesis protein CcmI [Rhodoplanes sp.]NVO14483.1 c-type cytochrome biogenesis protein CcmI [Rhodoplanes sp.]
MTFSLLLALMTAVALGAALWPLVRRPAPSRGGDDVAIYRDQLDEIERDLSTGAIAPAEAEAARVEVSRRLIAAAEATPAADPAVAPSKSPALRRVAAAVLIVLPLAGLGYYLATGSPDMPGQPLADRLARVHEGQGSASDESAAMAAMVPRVEAHLRANPEDGRGWAVLGPAYMRLERFDDAAKAYRNAIRLLGETGDRVADLGEALVGQAGGTVTPAAKAQFERAVALDREHVSGRFYLGLAAKQSGQPEAARRMWEALLAKAPEGAPWVGFVKTALAGLDGAGQGGAAVDVPQALTDDQKTMVRGMIDQLAERLRKNGSDVEGWLRLVRSHMVMRETDKARAALAEARRALADMPDRLVRLESEVRPFRLDAATASSGPAPAPRAATPGGSPAIALPALPGETRPGPRAEPAPAAPSAAASAAPEGTADYDETMRGLVDRLAKRLAADGGDIDGWVRLMRTHMAMGERARATAAAADARKALAGAPEKLARLDAVVKELGLAEAPSGAVQ